MNCVILEKRGDDIVVDTNERVGRFVTNSLETYKLKKRKDTLPSVCYDYITKSLKGVGCIHLYKYGSNQYKPIDVRGTLEGKKFEIIDTDDWNFKIIENRATSERRKILKKKLEQYLPMIVFIICGAVFITIAAMSYGMMRDLLSDKSFVH